VKLKSISLTSLNRITRQVFAYVSMVDTSIVDRLVTVHVVEEIDRLDKNSSFHALSQ